MIDMNKFVRDLDREIKNLPTIPASVNWKQSGWGVVDPSIELIDEPLVKQTLYRFTTKIVKQRENGWEGHSLWTSVMFDDDTTPEELLEHLIDIFKEKIHRLT